MMVMIMKKKKKVCKMQGEIMLRHHQEDVPECCVISLCGSFFLGRGLILD